MKLLSEALTREPANLECLYLLASCQHAVGEFREAVATYQTALEVEVDSGDALLQVLAFYQRHLALYTASKLSRPMAEFQLDKDMSPRFKVGTERGGGGGKEGVKFT